jgi:hypothetical protein
MPPTIDTSLLTDGAELAKDMSDVIAADAFTDPELNEFHDINEDIKADKQVPILDLMTGLMGRKKQNCDTTPNDQLSINTKEKFWTPVYHSDRIAICYDEFSTSFFKWLRKEGIAKENIEATDIANFILERTATHMKQMLWEKLYFADKNAVAGTDNGLSAGQLPYMNTIDGFFTQGFAIAAANASQRVTIAKNAEATNADQKFTAADIAAQTVTGYLDEMYYNSDIRLRGKDNLKYLVTQTVFDQYVRERKSITGSEIAYTRTETGIKIVQFNGIDVQPVNVWDRTLASYFQVVTGPNTNTFLPHRALLTTTNNLKPGTEKFANLSELDVIYDKVGKQFLIDFGFNLDAQIGIDEYLMIGY